MRPTPPGATRRALLHANLPHAEISAISASIDWWRLLLDTGSEPQNNHDFLPGVMPRSPLSTALLKGMLSLAPLPGW
jgi:hypothetical protein